MDNIRECLSLSALPGAWCEATLESDFCSYDWPSPWSFSPNLLGLERPLIKSLKHVASLTAGDVTRDDVTRLQCALHLVLESGVRGEGSTLPCLLFSTFYLKLCARFPQKLIYHEVLYGKLLEVLESAESEEEGAIEKVHSAITSLISSRGASISERCTWLTIKSILGSLRNNPGISPRALESFTSSRKRIKFFMKESLNVFLEGKSPLADTCCKLLSGSEGDTTLLVQHLLTGISERTGPRRETEEYILQLIKSLPDRSPIVDWIISEYSISKKVVHRLFAVEMCFQLSHITSPDSLQPLYTVIVESLSDKAPTVRAKALIVLSDLLKTSSAETVFPIFEQALPLLKYHCNDGKSSVRKAASQVLKSLLVHIRVDIKWGNLLYQLCLDEAVSVRKQALQGVSMVTKARPETREITRLWLESLLPSVSDVEKGVQELGVKIVTDMVTDPERNWKLLQQISDPCSTDMQVYLGRALQDCQLSDSAREYITSRLPEPTSLMLVSMVPKQFPLSGTRLMRLLAECPETDQGYQQMCLITKCLRETNPTDTSVFTEMIGRFSLPHAVVRELLQLVRFVEGDDATVCYETLLNVITTTLGKTCLSENSNQPLSSRRFSCYLFTLGEISMFTSVGETAVLALKEILVSGETFSTMVRSHAVLALGKISLVDEPVAKDAVLLLSRLLGMDESAEVRNNCLVILGDLVVRYPTLVTDYTHCLTDTLGDESEMVRRQSLILHSKLLQADYLKWRSGTVFKFLSNLVHDNIEIRRLCELCLTNIILVRFPSTFYDFLVEAVFFSNGKIELIQSTEPNLIKFSSPGDPKKRRAIYKVLLQKFDDQQKLGISGRVCKDILGMFITDDSPITDDQKPVLEDALWILRSPLLKLKSLKTRPNNDFDEGDEQVEAIQAQTKVISVIVKRNFVENCFPIITSLRSKLKELKSPLQRELSQFLASFLSDYKSEIAEVCETADEHLLSEVQFDISELEKEEGEDVGEGSFMRRGGETPGIRGLIAPSTILHSPFFSAPTPVRGGRAQTQDASSQNLVKRLFKTPSKHKDLTKLVRDAINRSKVGQTMRQSLPPPREESTSEAPIEPLEEEEVPRDQVESSQVEATESHIAAVETEVISLPNRENQEAEPSESQHDVPEVATNSTSPEETLTDLQEVPQLAASSQPVPQPTAPVSDTPQPVPQPEPASPPHHVSMTTRDATKRRIGKTLHNPNASVHMADVSLSPQKPEKKKVLVVGKQLAKPLPPPPAESLEEMVKRRMERMEQSRNKGKRSDRRKKVETTLDKSSLGEGKQTEPKPSAENKAEVTLEEACGKKEEKKGMASSDDTKPVDSNRKKAMFVFNMLKSKKKLTPPSSQDNEPSASETEQKTAGEKNSNRSNPQPETVEKSNPISQKPEADVRGAKTLPTTEKTASPETADQPAAGSLPTPVTQEIPAPISKDPPTKPPAAPQQPPSTTSKVPPTSSKVPPTTSKVPPTSSKVPPTSSKVPPTSSQLPVAFKQPKGRPKLNFGRLKRKEEILVSTQTDQIVRKRAKEAESGYEIVTESPAPKRRSIETAWLGNVTFEPKVASTPFPGNVVPRRSGRKSVAELLSGKGKENVASTAALEEKQTEKQTVSSTPVVSKKGKGKLFNCDLSCMTSRFTKQPLVLLPQSPTFHLSRLFLPTRTQIDLSLPILLCVFK
eukprot:sb/3460730/